MFCIHSHKPHTLLPMKTVCQVNLYNTISNRYIPFCIKEFTEYTTEKKTINTFQKFISCMSFPNNLKWENTTPVTPPCAKFNKYVPLYLYF